MFPNINFCIERISKRYKWIFLLSFIVFCFFISFQTVKAQVLPPTNLTAEVHFDETYGLYRVYLTWEYPPAELLRIQGFNVYRDLQKIDSVGTTTLYYYDYPTSQAGITYDYNVTAYRGATESGYSNTASVTTNAPNAPSSLKVEGEMSATTTEDFTPELSWFYSDSGDYDMAFFRIQVCANDFDSFNNCPVGQLMWDSGKTTSTAANNSEVTASYNDSCSDNNCSDDDKDSYGHPLDWHFDGNYDYYHWRVKVWNSDGAVSSWSSSGEPAAQFRYGNIDETETNLIFTDDIKTTTYQGAVTLDNPPEYYTGAQGEVRFQYFWPTGGSPNGTIVDNGNNVGSFTAIALDSKNNPHICYHIDDGDLYNSPFSGGVKYASYNGTSWTYEYVDSGGGGFNCSLAIDKNDIPHLSYYSTTTAPRAASLIYAVKLGSVWATTTVTSTVSTMPQYSRTSIVIDQQNNPAICYHYNPSYPGRVNCARKTGPNISDWTIDGKSVFTDSNTGLHLSLTVDQNNLLHLAYSDQTNKTLKYRSYSSGSGWSAPVEVYTNSPNDYPANISITVDKNGDPGISSTAKIGGTATLKYSKKIAGSWSTENVYEYNNAQPYTGLAFDTINPPQPRIVFNGGAGALFYESYENDLEDVGAWIFTTLEEAGVIGRYSSQALDNNDLPRLSYWNFNNKDLMTLRPIYYTTIGSISSFDVSTTTTIYGLRFHASYSKPVNAANYTLTFQVTANGGVNWVNVEDNNPAGCLNTPEGCTVSFANPSPNTYVNWTGEDLRWQVEIKTNDPNFTPHIGSVAMETYNIPPIITYCSYEPPAIEPGQSVEITAWIVNEPTPAAEYKWQPENEKSGSCEADPSWTEWGAPNPLGHLYENPCIYNPRVQAREGSDPNYTYGNTFTCPDFFVGNVMISWLETKFGNVYSQKDIHSYGVPVEPGIIYDRFNATYILEAGGQILGFSSQCESLCVSQLWYGGWNLGYNISDCRNICIKENSSNIYKFPKYSLKFRNVFGDLKADPLIKGLLSDPIEPTIPFDHIYDIFTNPEIKDVADMPCFWTSGPYDDQKYHFDNYEGGNIYYITNSNPDTLDPNYKAVPLNSESQANLGPPSGWERDLKGFRNGPSSLSRVGDGLIIVDGDLHIYSGQNGGPGTATGTTPKITYDETNNPSIEKISDLASIAWIIKGDLIIEKDVEELAGSFIVLGADDVPSCAGTPIPAHCGAIYTAGKGNEDRFTPVNDRKQLTIHGLVMAKRFVFNRYYFNWLTQEPAEIIANDGRAMLNPPPGLEDLISSLPNWRTKIVP